MERPSRDDVLTVRQLTSHIKTVLAREFPDNFWLTGEISSKKTNKGYVRFDLLDRPSPTASHVAKISVNVKPPTVKRIREAATQAGVRFEDGVPIKLSGRLVTWEQSGVYQFEAQDVDAVWTVGQQKVSRDQTIAVLKKEGILKKNSQVALPAMPMNVALITSPGSHAQADFTTTLESSSYCFNVKLFPSLVQGSNAPRELKAALLRVHQYHQNTAWRPHVVVFVRGGGARSDLLAFDDVNLARTVAHCPYPVLSAVGHEKDTSVLDEVAGLSVKTPTASAQLLVGRVDASLAQVDRLQAKAYTTVQSLTSRFDEALPELAARALKAGVNTASRVTLGVDDLHRRALRESTRTLEENRLQVNPMWGRLTRIVEHLLDRASADVGLLDAKSQAFDPEVILARGFSVTRRADGTVVSSSREVKPDEVLSTRLVDGVIRSRVV